MPNLPLPQRMFCKGGEPDQSKKVNFYFVLKYLGTVKKALEKHKKEWSQLWNSQFRYLLEHGGDVAFSAQFAHFMLSRQLVTEKKHEIWIEFGGAPIRFSIQEFSAATGLNCSKLPEIPQELRDVKNFDEHENTYWDELIGNDLGEIDDEWIVKKLNSKNFKDPRKKLQLCCLLLVDALLCPRSDVASYITHLYSFYITQSHSHYVVGFYCLRMQLYIGIYTERFLKSMLNSFVMSRNSSIIRGGERHSHWP